MRIEKKYFGALESGEKIYLYTLKNSQLEVEIINYGGTIRRILSPDREGKFENVVIGCETLYEYESSKRYFGSITGRVAGRIKNGELLIKNKLYQLEKNSGNNNLHGGNDSLYKKVWQAETLETSEELKLILTYTSPHLENGFPGKVDFKVEYTVKENSLIIDYLGIPDRETYISLTNHAAFNLSGDYKRDINDHKIFLDADCFLEVNNETLPIAVKSLNGTVMDLRKEVYFKNFLSSEDAQIKIVNGGIDHGFILAKRQGTECICRDEVSGRKLSVITDQPVIVFYTGNYLDKVGRLIGGVAGLKHLGFCLETQDYPDIFNMMPEKVRLYSPESPYYQTTTLKFEN